MKTLFSLRSLIIAITTLPFIANGGPLIVGHRGASSKAPENTLPAFELAWKQGAHAIEGDFRLTKDGHIVCIHDADTKRVADKKLVVAESTLAELRSLDLGVKHSATYKGTTIPTIAEVLSTIPEGKKIFVEIKSGPEIIPPLLKEIKKSGLEAEQVLIICFNEKVLKQVKAKAPMVKVSWLCAFKKASSKNPSLENVLKTLKAINADGISTTAEIPKTYVQAIQEKGYDWHAWTINNRNVAKALHALRIVSITTDQPDLLVDFLPKDK